LNPEAINKAMKWLDKTRLDKTWLDKTWREQNPR
jgi:hypothetical protein